MPKIDDHSYLKICAELASCWSISLASARKKVELALIKQGKKGLDERKMVAEKMLKAVRLSAQKGEVGSSHQLDQLLEALAEEENFMIED